MQLSFFLYEATEFSPNTYKLLLFNYKSNQHLTIKI